MWLAPAAMKLFIFGSPTVGYEVRENIYVDMALPFGLQSAPFIFTAFADKVQWMLHFDHIDNFLCHYLDSLRHRHSVGSSWNLPPPWTSAEAKDTFLALWFARVTNAAADFPQRSAGDHLKIKLELIITGLLCNKYTEQTHVSINGFKVKSFSI